MKQEQQSREAVKSFMQLSTSAGMGPGSSADLIALSGVQLAMLAEFTRIYGVEFQESHGQEIVSYLLGCVVPSTVSFGSMASLLPGGAPAMDIFCGAATWAVGQVLVRHFESGLDFLSFDPSQAKEHFLEELAAGLALRLEAGSKSGAPA